MGKLRALLVAPEPLCTPFLPLIPAQAVKDDTQRASSVRAVGDGSKDAAGQTRIVEVGLTNSDGESGAPGSCKAMLDPDGKITGRTTAAECGRRGAMDQAIRGPVQFCDYIQQQIPVTDKIPVGFTYYSIKQHNGTSIWHPDYLQPVLGHHLGRPIIKSTFIIANMLGTGNLPQYNARPYYR